MDLEKQFNTIISILRNIETRLDKIEENIIGIKEDNKVVEKDCLKMREHIDFVEHTYDAVKMPLNYLKNNIEYIMGSKSPDLLLIEDK
jgi:archaellum component FlaC